MANLIESLLDEIDDELCLLDEAPVVKSTITSTTKQPSASSESDSEGVDIDVDQLDDLIADIERQDNTRRLPRTNEAKPVGARKNPKLRQQTRPRGALDGDDLDRILEEIQIVTKQRATQAVETLVPGWGVVNSERKFDFLAPPYALAYTNISASLIVSTPTGGRTRIPLQAIHVKIVALTPGAPSVRHILTDNKDGTYSIEFESQAEDVKYQIQVDVYNQRQFEWDVEICGQPEPSQCVAEVDPNGYRVNQKGEVILYAKDKNGRELKVGGSKVGLSFNGAGQLVEVGLLDRMNGTYALSFVPNAAGKYAIWLTVAGVDIKTCPIEFIVKP